MQEKAVPKVQVVQAASRVPVLDITVHLVLVEMEEVYPATPFRLVAVAVAGMAAEAGLLRVVPAAVAQATLAV
jgi:hypothetical protein